MSSVAKSAAVFLVALCAASGSLRADSYLDDRSGAAALVRSLYNAVNSKDFGRAYSYWAEPPAKSFDAYVKGYDGTAHVDVITGEPTPDGTAGSVFYAVPTAIRAKDDKGNTSYFAGCYTVRAITADQDPPVRPLQIHSAKLKPSKSEEYSHYSLPDCSNGAPAPEAETPDDETLLEKAKARFASEMAGECDKASDTLGGANDPEMYKIGFRYESASADEPEQQFVLFAFSCSMAAYNESNVFYGYDSVSGLHRLSFTEPHLDIKYADEENSKLASMTIDGFDASDMLTNAGYDEASRTISQFAKWRGIGDAASHGEYVFSEGQFVLKNYDVDPTTDEESNPYALIRNGKVLEKPEVLEGEQ